MCREVDQFVDPHSDWPTCRQSLGQVWSVDPTVCRTLSFMFAFSCVNAKCICFAYNLH